MTAAAQKTECLSTQIPQPEVLGDVVPYLCLDGASKAAELYKKAFVAREVFAMPVDEKGRTMHIHLYVNGGSLMLCDGYPEHGHPYEAPKGYTLHMRPHDLDLSWQRAVEAGCEIILPLQKMFWGERYGQLRDPFGVMWSMSRPE